MKETIICKNCGKEFQGYVSSHRMFCCKECVHEYMRNEANKRKLRKCKNCGVEFSPKENRTKFCCWECCVAYAKKNSYSRNTRKCEWCGREYYPKQFDQRYCSKKCGYEWYSEFKQTDEQKQIQSEKVIKSISNGKIKQAYTKPHVIIDDLLARLNIKCINEYNVTYYSIDIYLPENELMIEIMGDYWHSNPTTKFKECKSVIQQKRVPKDKAKHTYVKNKYGIEILYLWETDIYNNIELCEKLIELYIYNNGDLKDYNSFNYEVREDVIEVKDNIVKPLFLCS